MSTERGLAKLNSSLNLGFKRAGNLAKESIEVGTQVGIHTTVGALGGFLVSELFLATCTPVLALKRHLRNEPLDSLPQDLFNGGLIFATMAAVVLGGIEFVKQLRDPDSRDDRILRITPEGLINSSFAVSDVVRRIGLLPT